MFWLKMGSDKNIIIRKVIVKENNKSFKIDNYVAKE